MGTAEKEEKKKVSLDIGTWPLVENLDTRCRAQVPSQHARSSLARSCISPHALGTRIHLSFSRHARLLPPPLPPQPPSALLSSGVNASQLTFQHFSRPILCISTAREELSFFSTVSSWAPLCPSIKAPKCLQSLILMFSPILDCKPLKGLAHI